MNKKRVIGAAALIVAATTMIAAQQSARSSEPGDVALKTAINRELADGDLKAAIARYQSIVDQYGKTDRAIAAQALLRMAEAYEKLGVADANKVYDTLVRQYADQPDVAATARARLAARQTTARGGTITLAKVFDGPNAGRFGSVSRDGRYLSYMDSATLDLGIRDLTTGSDRRITTHPGNSGESAEYSAFSRDGKRLAYGWQSPSGTYELRTIDREGGTPKVLYSNALWLWPYDWSPEGRTVLALIAPKTRARQLAFVSAADGSVRVLKTLDWNMDVPGRAEYSPDGRFIAYDRTVTEEPGRGRDVFVIAVDGSREIPIATGPSHENLLGWFPDGSSILVSSDRAGSIGAYAVAMRDGQPQGELRPVKPDVGHIRPFGFTAAGAFVYHLQVGTADVWTVSIDARTGNPVDKPAPLPNRPRSPRNGPSWSPDNEHVSFRMGAIGEAIGLGVQSVKTGALRTIPLKLSYAAPPTWTPDGSGLVLFGTDLDARHGIFRIDATTGSAQMITEGEFDGTIAITADGQSLVYRRYEPQPQGAARTVIVTLNLKAGEQREVIRRRDPNISAFRLSPDGTSLALLVRGDKSASLEIVPFTGGASRVLLQFDDSNALPRGFAWTADGKSLLFVRANALWRIPVSGGAAEKLNISVPGMNGISLSPDGRHLAFGVQDIKEEVWSMQHVAPASAGAR